MATISEKRNAIVAKIQKLDQLKEERSLLDDKIFKEDGTYNYDVLDLFLKKAEEINRMQGVIKRMIKNLFKLIYGDWTFLDNEYTTIIREFYRFCF